jgi:hypothetical protein
VVPEGGSGFANTSPSLRQKENWIPVFTGMTNRERFTNKTIYGKKYIDMNSTLPNQTKTNGAWACKFYFTILGP